MVEEIDNSQRAKDMLEQAFGTNSEKVHKVLRNNAAAKVIYDAAISIVTSALDDQPVGVTESLDIMGAWSERLLRDQGFLMDLMIAGCIDIVNENLPPIHQIDTIMASMSSVVAPTLCIAAAMLARCACQSATGSSSTQPA